MKGSLAGLDKEAGKELLMGQTAALQAMVADGGEQAAAATAMLQGQVHSRRRDCHVADMPSPSTLKHLLEGEGVAAE